LSIPSHVPPGAVKLYTTVASLPPTVCVTCALVAASVPPNGSTRRMSPASKLERFSPVSSCHCTVTWIEVPPPAVIAGALALTTKGLSSSTFVTVIATVSVSLSARSLATMRRLSTPSKLGSGV
jgi:hypothetical protein